jgi:protein-tyrosine phosphatase
VYWEHNWRILPDLVGNALRAIASASPGVLVHCSAGRDRTGMITALLLGNAGVPPAVVADDYAQSVRAMAGIPAHTPTHDRQSVWTPSEVESWVAQSTPLVRAVAHDAESTLARLGLTKSERATLRELLTSGENPRFATRGSRPEGHL